MLRATLFAARNLSELLEAVFVGGTQQVVSNLLQCQLFYVAETRPPSLLEHAVSRGAACGQNMLHLYL